MDFAGVALLGCRGVDLGGGKLRSRLAASSRCRPSQLALAALDSGERCGRDERVLA